MTQPATNFSATRKRFNPWVVFVIVLIHIGIFYVLIRALAPGVVSSVERSVLSTFTVTVTAPEPPPPPPPEAAPQDEGAQGDPGRDAVPKPVTAPTPKIPIRKDPPAPKVASTGAATTAGATDSGQGTGAAGQGQGTGSGNAGTGRGGGGPVTKPVLIATISDASAFPVPEGGRKARIGKSVIVRLMVSTEGRATSCRIHRPSPFPETDATVCRLAIDQVRFKPATNAAGQPVAAPFYYQQRFFN
ncbi:TonB family protein [Qipengyuania marisflavi]|uniref:TonB family protein n=1 Tax=Qipengyuania marisflavi TaxID=2486356 RepID=A0A5S3P0B3_9SPHN|nr:TonB family protein [Qipengyuania marisflavi]TMM46127.1 TonB family protein [Qipengyuania marisflavi]